MPAEKFTYRFAVRTIEIQKFIEYCKRFQVIDALEVGFTVTKEFVEDDSFIWNDLFTCDVSFTGELDALKFINVFSLFFSVSKYCTRV